MYDAKGSQGSCHEIAPSHGDRFKGRSERNLEAAGWTLPELAKHAHVLQEAVIKKLHLIMKP